MYRAHILVCLGFVAFGGCTTAPSATSGSTEVVERRDSVTYSASDWTHGDTRHTVDVAAHPVEGMAAFVSRLDYPRNLRRRHVQGIMRVRVALDAAGRIVSARVVQSVDPVLDSIVLKAVHECRWQSAIRGGKAVAWTFTFLSLSYRTLNQTVALAQPR
jgi:TonB family protein